MVLLVLRLNYFINCVVGEKTARQSISCASRYRVCCEKVEERTGNGVDVVHDRWI